MSINEKRRNARSGLSIGDEHNLFFLLTGDKSYEINMIRDVSISGVGLAVHCGLEPGQTIALRYDSSDFELTINGTVAWCSESLEDGNWNIGVEFDPANRESNALFFLALRKYLDDFDSAYMEA